MYPVRAQTVGNLLQVLTNPAADLVAARGLACVLLRQAFDATNAAQVPQPSVIVFGEDTPESALWLLKGQCTSNHAWIQISSHSQHTTRVLLS